MALPAFKEAYDLLRAAPAPPQVPRPKSAAQFRRTIEKTERAFASDVARWSSQLRASMPSLGASFEELVRASYELRGDASGPLQQLRRLIDETDEGIKNRQKLRIKLEGDFSAEVPKIAARSVLEAHFFRTSSQRFLDLMDAERAARIEFNSFLNALYTKHSPPKKAPSALIRTRDRMPPTLTPDVAHAFVYSPGVRARFCVFLMLSIVGIAVAISAMLANNQIAGTIATAIVVMSGFAALSWLELAERERSITN